MAVGEGRWRPNPSFRAGSAAPIRATCAFATRSCGQVSERDGGAAVGLLAPAPGLAGRGGRLPGSAGRVFGDPAGHRDRARGPRDPQAPYRAWGTRQPGGGAQQEQQQGPPRGHDRPLRGLTAGRAAAERGAAVLLGRATGAAPTTQAERPLAARVRGLRGERRAIDLRSAAGERRGDRLGAGRPRQAVRRSRQPARE